MAADPNSPKYLAPETGATWSGRERAPAWLGGIATSF
ncbi:H-NS family nucleoid-associated regulatory protein [Cupriavidus sp. 8B]